MFYAILLNMKLKANLHFHSNEDIHHSKSITYNLFEGVDQAAALGFKVLASTCHQRVVCTPKHITYAKSKGILLIPGIEKDIYDTDKNKGHVVILNCTSEIETLTTFEELVDYKVKHPEIFILAAHPYYFGGFSLKKNLEKYINLFDGIELSWFYSKHFDFNKKAHKMATLYNKPYIATSDTHYFDFMNKNYTIAETNTLDTQEFFLALKNHQYSNVTSPRKFWRECILRLGIFTMKNKIGNRSLRE